MTKPDILTHVAENRGGRGSVIKTNEQPRSTIPQKSETSLSSDKKKHIHISRFLSPFRELTKEVEIEESLQM